VYRYQDQGIQDFRYTIVPHDGDWRDGGTVRRAAELNQPPIAILESFHDGALAHNGSFLDVSGDGSVDVAVVKGDEDDTGAVVIRAWETGGRSADARIGLLAWGRSIERRFGPGEIVSFLVPRDPTRPVEEIDLIERPLASEATRANL
jgi:alpha-mannosidase